MILTYIELSGTGIHDQSLAMLTPAREIADGGAVAAVLVGAQPVNMADQLAEYGVSKLFVVTDERLQAYAPQAVAAAVAQVAAAVGPEAVLAAGTERGNELMARVGALLGRGMAANCTAVSTGDDYTVTRIRWGGSLLEEARLVGSPKLLTAAPLVFTAVPAPVPECGVEPFPVELSDNHFRVQVAKHEQPEEGKVSLGDARLVVGGGRGVGSAEGFAVLDELADLLGGVVGGSRVVTNLGWRPHADQVGQTGTRIGPDLYIACGISGAIQHWVGCKGSKAVLAINTDPEAPIMAKADYTVVGDLHEVLPALIAELRK
jgi:electron transfer flavoprotein alpha subunit